VRPGRTHWYRVSASDGVRFGPASAPLAAAAPLDASGAVTVRVDASRAAGALKRPWEVMVNSEHPSYLVNGDLDAQLPSAAEGLRSANRRLHDDFGIRYVRAHGIFLDDLGTCRAAEDGAVVFDWRGIDRVYDLVLEDGLKPFVELSFMPAALAAAPRRKIFHYGAIASPPRDYAQWGALVRGFAQHLIDRYGADEVRSWYFEVWNEPDLHMRSMNFWRGSLEDYHHLYDVTVAALKSVDARLRVGGPAAALPQTIEPFLRHVKSKTPAGSDRTPLDFLSFHLYASPFIDWRPLLAKYGLAHAPVFYSEWGISGRAGDSVNDLPYGAALLASIVIDSDDAADMAACWEGSDYDEERPPTKFLHGGFGLLGLEGIRKPRYWAYFLLHRLGTERLTVRGNGDGFGGLVKCWATRSDRGFQVLLSNVTPNQGARSGDPTLDRKVKLAVEGLVPGSQFRVRHARVDRSHSNVHGAWENLGKPAWPNAGQLETLRRQDELGYLESDRDASAMDSGAIELEFALPMPALSLVELIQL
jgi:xylan 1,4-beta-xylosidase